MRDPEASDFCYYPFFQVLVTAEGKYRPCSKHVDHMTHEGKVLTTANATLEEAWNSDYMKRMRDDFNANRQFPGCAECWRLQKIGLKSMRYDSWQYNIPESQVENPEKPLRIELNSSNVCNLRCRICFATASTQWLSEAKKLYGYDENLHINLGTENLKQVKAWAANLHELCLFGGEPLILPGNIDLLDYLIEKDYAKDISLLFNTNGTIFNKEISDRLKQFRRVRISFSIDDIGKRFEYQRTGGKWSEVEANLKEAYTLFKSPGYEHVEMKICCTVSMFNAYYLPEFFEYFGREFPGLKIFFNYFYDPTRLCVQILPDAEKEILIDRISKIEPNFDLRGEDGKLIENIITYIEYREKRPMTQFFGLVNRHDVFRNESYPEVFPEFWSLIKKYKPAELKMGIYETGDIDKLAAWPDHVDFSGKLEHELEAIREENVKCGSVLNDGEEMILAAYRLFEMEKVHFISSGKVTLLDSYLDYVSGKGVDIPNSSKGNYHPSVFLGILELYAKLHGRSGSIQLSIDHLRVNFWNQLGTWEGMDQILELDANELLDKISGYQSLPVEADKLSLILYPPMLKSETGMSAAEEAIRAQFKSLSGDLESGLPAGAENSYLILTMFEPVKKYFRNEYLPAVFDHYRNCITGTDHEGSQNGVNGSTKSREALSMAGYFSCMLDAYKLFHSGDNTEKIEQNLKWLKHINSETDLPKNLMTDMMRTEIRSFLNVMSIEDIPQLSSIIEERYEITV